jgi:hypothetical protein
LREQYSCKIILEHTLMIPADYYYVMTFLQTSCQFVRSDRLTATALSDKVSLSFNI